MYFKRQILIQKLRAVELSGKTLVFLQRNKSLVSAEPFFLQDEMDHFWQQMFHSPCQQYVQKHFNITPGNPTKCVIMDDNKKLFYVLPSPPSIPSLQEQLLLTIRVVSSVSASFFFFFQIMQIHCFPLNVSVTHYLLTRMEIDNLCFYSPPPNFFSYAVNTVNS